LDDVEEMNKVMSHIIFYDVVKTDTGKDLEQCMLPNSDQLYKYIHYVYMYIYVFGYVHRRVYLCVYACVYLFIYLLNKLMMENYKVNYAL
jgi:hypothetical protein